MSGSMIASVLQLDRTAIKALKITDVYSLHRVVYSLFSDVRSEADKAAGVSSGILWADQGGNGLGRTLLLLSDREPARCLDGGYGEVRSKVISAEFMFQPQYQFRVTVNPAVRDSKTGRQKPVKGREAISAWFCQRAVQSWGFEVDARSVQVNSVQVQQFNDKAQRQVTLAQAQLQGRLRVTDSEQFSRSFSQGIGRGRAFGCGLLQVVPVMDNPFE